MIAEQPNVVLDGRYSIKETCKILNICRQSLHKYTHETCDIKCNYTLVGGRRRKFYYGKEILKFWNKELKGGLI